MPPLRLTRAGLLGSLLILAAAAGCVRLGFWQLDRLEQRRERNARIAARYAAPPAPLSAATTDTAGLLFRTLDVEGEYDQERSIVLAARSHRGVPGVHLLTPLRLAQGRGAILVDRGWVPSPDAASVDFQAFPAPGAVRLAALAMPFPEAPPRRGAPDAALEDGPSRVGEGSFRRVWFRVDVEALRAQFPYPVAAFYLQALPAGEEAAGYPVRLPPPVLDEGSHLGYAVQWFAFALVAVVGWVLLLVRRGEATRPRSS